MDKTRVFKPYDILQLNRWLFNRDMTPLKIENLPKSGFIIDEIAVGFLILTNTNAGILDYFISNPLSKKEERSDALISIANRLIILAKTAGLTAIKCDTKYKSVAEKLQSVGFKETGSYQSFFREI